MIRLQKYFMVGTLLYPAMTYSQHPIDNKNSDTSMNTIMTTTIHSNKAIVRMIYEQALNRRNMALLQELISPAYIGINGAQGAASFADPIAQVIKSFPDIQWNIQELMQEGNNVAVKWEWQGTHQLPFNNFEATNKLVHNEGMAIFKLKDGQIIASQVQTDRLGFLQAIDVLPADLASVSKRQDSHDQVQFIDKFFVPAPAKEQFLERMKINRDLIKTLSGFIEDKAYIHTDDNDNLICITIALWKDMEAVRKAKDIVQEAYKKQGFNLQAFLSSSNITMERALFKSF
jgi:predicted ester cyclase